MLNRVSQAEKGGFSKSVPSAKTLNPKTLSPKTLRPQTLNPKTLNPKLQYMARCDSGFRCTAIGHACQSTNAFADNGVCLGIMGKNMQTTKMGLYRV